MLNRYLSRLPLTDRITFAIEFRASALFGVHAGLVFPLIPIMARKLGLGAEGIAVMLAMQFVGAAFGLLIGHLADRLPKMPLVVWPLTVARACVILLAFVRGPAGFFVIASLFYAGTNLGGPAFARIMRSNYSDANRSRLMGVLRIEAMAISAVCSVLVSPFLASDAAFRLLFPISGLAGALSALVFGRIKVRKIPGLERKSVPVTFRASLAVVGKNAAFILFMGILMLCAGPEKLTLPIEPIRFVDELGIDYRQTTFILGGVVSVFGIIGYYLWARMLKRRSPFAILAIVTLLGAARTAVIAAATDILHLIPASAFLGLINAGWDLAPLFCIIVLADPESFALYFGFHTTLVGIRGLAGPAIGTLLFSTGAMSVTAIFWIVSAFTAAGGIALAWFSRRLKRRPFITRPL